MVVGALGDDSYTGAAYVFVYDGNIWPQVAKLTASDGVPYDSFGRSVAIYGGSVVIGAWGDNLSIGGGLCL